MGRSRDKGRSGRGRAQPQRPARQRPERHPTHPGTAKFVEEPLPRFAVTRDVRRLLEGIGQPRPAPFKPDPFQVEALAALEFEDVLVTAPTGSGKTWIAREEIRRLLDAGRRAWYTTPLKALTNSKYQEFMDEFGSDQVGILTGDRKDNADA